MAGRLRFRRRWSHTRVGKNDVLAGPDRFESGLLGSLSHLNHIDWVATNSEIDAKKTYFHDPSLWPPLRGESSRSNSTNQFFFAVSGATQPSEAMASWLCHKMGSLGRPL